MEKWGNWENMGNFWGKWGEMGGNGVKCHINVPKRALHGRPNRAQLASQIQTRARGGLGQTRPPSTAKHRDRIITAFRCWNAANTCIRHGGGKKVAQWDKKSSTAQGESKTGRKETKAWLQFLLVAFLV